MQLRTSSQSPSYTNQGKMLPRIQLMGLKKKSYPNTFLSINYKYVGQFEEIKCIKYFT